MNDILIQPPCGIHRQEWIISVNFHSKCEAHICYQCASSPQSDNTQGLPHQFRSGKRGLPFLHQRRDLISHIRNGFYPFNTSKYVAGSQNQLTHHQLLDRFRIGAGTVKDNDTVLCASLHRNIVVPCAGTCDRQKVVIGFKIQNIRGTNDNSIRILNLSRDRISSFFQNISSHFGNVVDRLNLCHKKLSP